MRQRIELSLKRSFETSSQALRAAASNSLMARATCFWAEDMALKEPKLSKRAKNSLKKISLAAALTADSSYDARQLSARAMAPNVAARRNIWLRQWDGDSSSVSGLVGVPFKGEKFGEALEPFLIETKDKREVLPSGRKEHIWGKTHSFRAPGNSTRGRVFSPKRERKMEQR